MKQLDYFIEVSQNDIKNFSIFLLERENAEATVKKYVADIRTFFRYLNGNMQIDKKVLMGYKEWLVEKYAINSVNSMLAALNQFLEFMGIGTLKVKRIKIQRWDLSRKTVKDPIFIVIFLAFTGAVWFNMVSMLINYLKAVLGYEQHVRDRFSGKRAEKKSF